MASRTEHSEALQRDRRATLPFRMQFIPRDTAVPQRSSHRRRLHPTVLAVCWILCFHSLITPRLQGTPSPLDSTVSLSGTVTYISNNRPVERVTVTLSGGAVDSTTTGIDGRYLFDGLPAGEAYAITPAKPRDLSPVSASDASLILQHIFQKLPLTKYQYLAANVVRDGILSTLDATAILKYIAFLGPKYFVTSSNAIGLWGFEPPLRHCDPLSADLLEQTFSAYVLGDINGSWGQTVIPQDTVSAWFRWTSPLPGNTVSIKGYIDGAPAQDIYAFHTILTYDRSMLTFGTISGPRSGGCSYDTDPGTVSLAWAGDEPLNQSEAAFTIDFQVSPRARIGQEIAIGFETATANDGSPWVQTTDASMPIVPVPDISLSEQDHNFGNVGIGKTHEWTLRVTNDGLQDLTIFDIQLEQPPFSVHQNVFSLPPGQSEEVKVTFAPTSKERFFAWMTILSNDADESRLQVSLSGQGIYVQPDIHVTEEHCDFGRAAVQGISSQTIAISNHGSDDLVISQINSDHPEFTASHSGFILGPKQSKAITITCSPAAEGPISGRLTISSNDPDEGIVTISLEAIGVAPEAILYLSNGSGSPGSTRNLVSVFLDNRMKVGGVEVVLAFDSDVLQATEVIRTSRSASMSLFGADLKYETGEVRLLIVDLKRKTISEGSGSVADFSFDVFARATPGVYPIIPTQALVADTDGKTILTAVQESRFFVTDTLSRTWWVDLTVTSLDPAEHPVPLTFGIYHQGTDGFDAGLDVLQAPRPADSGFSAYFSLDLAQPERLCTDFRSPEEGTIMWTIVTQGKGGIVSWNHTDVPSSGRFVIGTSALVEVDMREFSSVLFNAGDILHLASACPVSVEDEDPALIPSNFSLWQNYPNPFNPTTTISYTIPVQNEEFRVKGGEGTLHSAPFTPHVTLKIFNVMGQEVRTLVDGLQQTGTYSVTWDGHDAAGRPVPSGVYIYRLSGDGGRIAETKRMVLMK